MPPRPRRGGRLIFRPGYKLRPVGWSGEFEEIMKEIIDPTVDHIRPSRERPW
jgi:hypothetical protein